MSNALKGAVKALAKQVEKGKQFPKSTKKKSIAKAARGRSRNQVPTSAPRQRVGGNLKLTTNNQANKAMPRSMMTKIVETDEYLGDVSGTTGTVLSTTSYAWNPGQSGTFAWLAKEALQWEKWEMVGDAEVYYKREVSEYATAGTTGKVLLSFDVDPHDPPPATKQQVEDTDIRVDGLPSENFSLRLPATMVNGWKPKNVRPGNLPGGADIETYDGGNLYVSTYGNAATSVMGEVRIRARFKFLVKVLESTTTAPTQYHCSWFQSTATEASGATTVPKTLAVATATVNALNVVNTAGSLVPPPGNYLIDTFVNVAFSASGIALTSLIDVQKNGTSVFKTLPGADSTSDTAANPDAWTISKSAFVACNGTDAITLVVTNTFASGTAPMIGSVRIVSI